MMKRFSQVILLFVLTLLLFGCEKEMKIVVKSGENTNVNPDVLKDRDTLIKLVHNSDDFNAVSYSDQELKDMKDHYDYKKVINDFVKDKLKEEIETFQTISKTVNPRWLVVTTKNHKVFYISMQKWNNYNGIWTVNGYTEFRWSTYPTIEEYKLLKKEDINGKLLDWFNSEMKTTEWKTDFAQIDGKTYALVKSSSKDSDSVELDDVIIFQGTAELRYQAFDYQSVSQETKALINDYLLIQINLPDSKIPIDFVKTYTNITPSSITSENNKATDYDFTTWNEKKIYDYMNKVKEYTNQVAMKTYTTKEEIIPKYQTYFSKQLSEKIVNALFTKTDDGWKVPVGDTYVFTVPEKGENVKIEIQKKFISLKATYEVGMYSLIQYTIQYDNKPIITEWIFK